MKDRFKFRVWCAECDSYVAPHVITIDDEGDMRLGHVDMAEDDGYAHEQSMTIEQCTGQSDLDGKLIYEGDILRIKLNSQESRDIPVTWWIDGFVCDTYSLGCILHEARIVGNIHQNIGSEQ